MTSWLNKHSRMRKLKALQAKCLMFRMHFLLVIYKGKATRILRPITSREGQEGSRGIALLFL